MDPNYYFLAGNGKAQKAINKWIEDKNIELKDTTIILDKSQNNIKINETEKDIKFNINLKGKNKGTITFKVKRIEPTDAWRIDNYQKLLEELTIKDIIVNSAKMNGTSSVTTRKDDKNIILIRRKIMTLVHLFDPIMISATNNFNITNNFKDFNLTLTLGKETRYIKTNFKVKKSDDKLDELKFSLQKDIYLGKDVDVNERNLLIAIKIKIFDEDLVPLIKGIKLSKDKKQVEVSFQPGKKPPFKIILKIKSKINDLREKGFKYVLFIDNKENLSIKIPKVGSDSKLDDNSIKDYYQTKSFISDLLSKIEIKKKAKISNTNTYKVSVIFHFNFLPEQNAEKEELLTIDLT